MLDAKISMLLTDGSGPVGLRRRPPMYVPLAEFEDSSGDHVVDCFLIELYSFVSLLLEFCLHRGSYL